MSYIANFLKEKYLNKIKTTKDLVYKDKVVDVHNLKASYDKLAASETIYKPLIKFNDNNYYIWISKDFTDILKLNVKLLDKTIPNSTFEEAIETSINSEIFNSLWIEGVKSSKKVIKQIVKNKKLDLSQESSKIASNYNDALKFIFTTRTINEQTLFALYQILSRDIDMNEEKLDGYPYRKDEVHIGNDGLKGISPELIKKSMDSMFEQISELESSSLKNIDHFINAILFHYHFEIIHPYYDMNGRTGRLLTLWYATKFNIYSHFAFFSEAINMFKEDFYYEAFKTTKLNDFKFDATYFIASIIMAMSAQKIVFLALKHIESETKNKFKKTLNTLQKDILTSLLSKDKDKYYKTQQFILGIDEINPAQVSLALSELVEFGILEEIESKPKEYKMVWSDGIDKLIKELS